MTPPPKMLTLSGLYKREPKPLASPHEIYVAAKTIFEDPKWANLPIRVHDNINHPQEGYLEVDCGHFRKSSLIHHYCDGPFLFGPWDMEYRFLNFQVLLKVAGQYNDLISLVEKQRANYSCDLTIDTSLYPGDQYALVTKNLQYLEDIIVMSRIRKQFRRKHPELKRSDWDDSDEE